MITTGWGVFGKKIIIIFQCVHDVVRIIRPLCFICFCSVPLCLSLRRSRVVVIRHHSEDDPAVK